MIRLEFRLNIAAQPDKVWNALWDAENYKKWTNSFCAGSHYKTDNFSVGSRIHFLTPEGHGMFSVIDVLDKGKYIAFRHIGDIENFEEKREDARTRGWSDAMEIYSLEKTNEGTVLTVQVDSIEKYVDWMNKAFPKALEDLKHLAEN